MNQSFNRNEKNAQPGTSRVSNLRTAYELGIHSLLRACSEEEFKNIFSSFKHSDSVGLYQLYLKMIPLVYDHVKEEFEHICNETQVMAALATLEQLIENQNLDSLHEEKPLIEDAKREIRKRKIKEQHYLETLVKELQETNLQNKKHLESLQNKQDDSSYTKSILNKLKDHNTTLERIAHDRGGF